MNTSVDTQAEPSFVQRHALRLYGGCAIGANVLVGLTGVATHDRFLQVAGFGTATAQLVNFLMNDRMKPVTIPAIIMGAATYFAGGCHAHNMGHVLFGSLKGIGAATLFYGEGISHAARTRLAPATRLLEKIRMPTVSSRLAGEVILGLAAAALGWDGLHKVYQGMSADTPAVFWSGARATAAAGALMVGQHFATKGMAARPAAVKSLPPLPSTRGVASYAPD